MRWPPVHKQFIIMCCNHLSFLYSFLPPWTLYTFLPPCRFHNYHPPLKFPISLQSSSSLVYLYSPSTALLVCFILPSSPLCLCTLALPRTGRGNLRPQLDSAMQDVSDLYLLMEETEKQAVRRALLEERGRYCTFINLLQPVVVRNI